MIYALSNRLAVRMDLLPHCESILVQKVTAFGHIYSKIYRISDLEYVPMTFDLMEKGNYIYQLISSILSLDLNLISEPLRKIDFQHFDNEIVQFLFFYPVAQLYVE